MRRYIVIAASANFNSGILELTREQAAPRGHSLDPLDKDLYLIKAPVQFKAGENIGYDGDVNKAMLALIEPEEGQKKKEPKGKTEKHSQ